MRLEGAEVDVNYIHGKVFFQFVIILVIKDRKWKSKLQFIDDECRLLF